MHQVSAVAFYFIQVWHSDSQNTHSSFAREAAENAASRLNMIEYYFCWTLDGPEGTADHQDLFLWALVFMCPLAEITTSVWKSSMQKKMHLSNTETQNLSDGLSVSKTKRPHIRIK